MMYTSIRNAIFKNLFDEGYRQCIGIAKFTAFWTDKKDKYMKTFDKSSLKLILDHLINNFHFTLSKKHFFLLAFGWILGNLIYGCPILSISSRKITSQN